MKNLKRFFSTLLVLLLVVGLFQTSNNVINADETTGFNVTKFELTGFTDSFKYLTEYPMILETDSDEITDYRVTMYYYNETSNKIFQFGSQDSKILFDDCTGNMKYSDFGKDYKFLMMTIFDCNNTGVDYRVYSSYSKDQLLNYNGMFEYIDSENATIIPLSQISNQDYVFEINDTIVDDEPPVINSVGWDYNVVYAPGNANLQFDATDNASGIENMKLYIKENNEKEVKVIDRHFWFETLFSFSRDTEVNNLEIVGIKLTDYKGNSTLYKKDGFTDSDAEKDAIIRKLPAISNLTIYNLEEKHDVILNDDDLKTTLMSVEEGQTVIVDTSNNTKIKTDIFQLIAGKDITIIFENRSFYDSSNAAGFQWIINGKDIDLTNWDKEYLDTTVGISTRNDFIDGTYVNGYDENIFGRPTVCTDFDEVFPKIYSSEDSLEVKNKAILEFMETYGSLSEYHIFKNYITYLEGFDIKTTDYNEIYKKHFKQNLYILLQFKNEGTLPGPMTIRLKPEYSLYDVLPERFSLVHIDGDKKEVINDNVTGDDESYFTATITHNSDYALVSNEQEATGGNKPTTNTTNSSTNASGVNTGDSTNTGALIMLLIASIYMMGSSFKKKKVK